MVRFKFMNKKARAGFMILNLVIAMFAFAFFVGFVSGQEEDDPNKQEHNLGNQQKNLSNTQDKTSGAGNKTAVAGGTTWLASLFKVETGGGADMLLSGLQYAGIAAGVAYLAGSVLGVSDNNKMALSISAALGFGVGKAVAVKYTAGWGIGIGAGVGIAALLILYKKEGTKVVEFQCLPWQPPVGGSDCEKCNDDDLPCSEYRCRSLGQSCEIVNQGTEEKRCVYVSRNDAKPPVITPNEFYLTSGYAYVDVKNSPPGPGFRIVRVGEANDCIKAFEPLKFGITLDEPGQCKIDYEQTKSFDEMKYYIGGSNMYRYNHSEQFSLPGPDNLKNENLTIKNDGSWTVFIRCMDKNGNKNEAEYAVRFCVDPSPDTTPAVIKQTSIDSGSPIPHDADKANVEFYTNEPAQCKWSSNDKDYDNMEYTMSCASSLTEINNLELYTCKTELTGVTKQLTDFYIRCKDQPLAKEEDRNVNRESYKFQLRGSDELKIRSIKPNSTVFGATDPWAVYLEVETLFGSDDGQSVCYYSNNDVDEDYLKFFETDTEDGIHLQRQDLRDGFYTYYVKCVDAAGNVAKSSVRFDVEIDTSSPAVARVYEEQGNLKIVTTVESNCAYSFDNCDFALAEGTRIPYDNSMIHITEWNSDKTYYIKCEDDLRSAPADCSIIVKPYDLK